MDLGQYIFFCPRSQQHIPVKQGLRKPKRHRRLIVGPAIHIGAIKSDGGQLEIVLVIRIQTDLRIPLRQPAFDLPVGDLLIEQRLLDQRIML